MPKWLELDHDNLHMKFLTLYADVSSLSLDFLHSMRPVHEGVKQRYQYFLKSDYSFAIGSSSMKMVADGHRHAAHHNKH